ncbi:MAG TPA: carbohydrate kinase family protein [Nocardioidaceae bacterium]|nr:carbohydrate kinase family protein [Nocardioidaceae bacterium]
MLIACIGDVLLDVVVEPVGSLSPDDDTPAVVTLAAGGQGANVAAWTTALGGRARVFGPGPDAGPGRLVADSLARWGVEVYAAGTGRTGAVVSLLTAGARSLASDPGDLGWLAEVAPGPWLDGVDWLFVSGYALLRAPEPERLVDTAAVARSRGARVALDLSSAALVSEFGAAAFSDLCSALRPSAVFATDEEWAAGPGAFGAGGDAVLVLKHGPRGASFVIDGITDHRQPPPGPVVDVTGAGDALAAGFLVGGVDLAMQAAARCVAQRGAQPEGPA